MKPVWQPAYIGVGSNLGEPAAQVEQALQRIAAIPQTLLLLRAPLFGSRPLGPVAQPDFVNGVAGVLTQLSAAALLQELQTIEQQSGRPAVHAHWGPRVLDLDLLVFGVQCSLDPALILPHPGIVARNFVLYPLAAIAPDLLVPGRGRVAQLKARVSAEGIWPLDGRRRGPEE